VCLLNMTLSGSSLKVKVVDQSSRSQEENVAKVLKWSVRPRVIAFSRFMLKTSSHSEYEYDGWRHPKNGNKRLCQQR